MMRSALTSIGVTWRTHKGAVGILIISLVLLFIGAQVQQWIDSRERTEIAAACDRRVLAVRNVFQAQANERNNIVIEVRGLAQQILDAQNKFLQLIQKRSAVTDHIAKRVDQIDAKASTAAVSAQKAASAAVATQDITVSEINRAVIDKKVRK